MTSTNYMINDADSRQDIREPKVTFSMDKIKNVDSECCMVGSHSRPAALTECLSLKGTGIGDGNMNYPCDLCGRSFKTKIGAGQHKKHTHPVEYNSEKLAKLKRVGGKSWSTVEDDSLLELANKIWLRHGNMMKAKLYDKVYSEFGHRSRESIKRRLIHLEWKAPETKNPIFGKEVNIPRVEVNSDECEMRSVKRSELLANIIAVCKKDSPLYKLAVKLSKGDLSNEQGLERLNKYAEKSFPYKVDRKRRKIKQKSPPTTENEKLKRNRDVLQSGMRKHKRETVKTVLNGQWRTAYKISKQITGECQEYW
ncbi:unnamed protein product, partial [Heterobilharzia americana]